MFCTEKPYKGNLIAHDSHCHKHVHSTCDRKLKMRNHLIASRFSLFHFMMFPFNYRYFYILLHAYSDRVRNSGYFTVCMSMSGNILLFPLFTARSANNCQGICMWHKMTVCIWQVTVRRTNNWLFSLSTIKLQKDGFVFNRCHTDSLSTVKSALVTTSTKQNLYYVTLIFISLQCISYLLNLYSVTTCLL